MVAPAHAKRYEGKPKYKLNLTAKQPYQQRACSAGCGTQTRTYCNCNWYKWIRKHSHVKHLVLLFTMEIIVIVVVKIVVNKWKCEKDKKT